MFCSIYDLWNMQFLLKYSSTSSVLKYSSVKKLQLDMWNTNHDLLNQVPQNELVEYWVHVIPDDCKKKLFLN